MVVGDEHPNHGALQGTVARTVVPRGHASIGITLDIYSHVLPTMQAEAARAIDELFRAS